MIAPMTCRNCGAKLDWRGTPTIQCAYCDHTITVQPPAAPAPPVSPPRGRGGWVAGIAVVAVLGGIAASAVRSSTRTTTRTTVSHTTVASHTSTSHTTSVAVSVTPAAKPPAANAQPAVATLVRTIGEGGTGAGQLTQPRALAVTPRGEIVVAESGSGRVQVFDATGAYRSLITLPPSALTKELTVFGAGAGPHGEVVVARAGDLLVLDVAAGKVARTIRGSYPDRFFHGDVDVAPDGSIHAITDRTGDLEVVHVSADGKTLGRVAKAGEHVAVDGLGTRFIARRSDDVIEVRDAKGAVVRRFSQGNPARGKLSNPGPIAIDGRGHVFVGEANRVLVFDPEGAFLGELEVGTVQDLAIDRAGALYVLGRDQVRVYAPSIRSPAGTSDAPISVVRTPRQMQ